MSSPTNSLSVDIVGQEVVPCVINNQIYTTGETFKVVDPHTGAPLHSAYCVQPDDAIKAVEAAAAALPAWRATPIVERRAIFSRAIEILKRRQEEFVGLAERETPCPRAYTYGELQSTYQIIEELVVNAVSALKGEIVEAISGQKAFISREPYGVVYSVTSWNSPIVLAVRAFCDPIIGGNTCVLKTSEYSPKIQAVLAEVFIEAGLPAGVLGIIHVHPKDAPKITELIIAHPAVGKISFTGSTRVGALIAQTCGKYVKPVMLELGGTCPLVILPDADLALAARSAIFGGFISTGQICMATNTIVVHEDVADEFQALLRSEVSKLKATNDPGSMFRGLVTSASANRLHGLVQGALDQGAQIVAGELAAEKNIMQPIVLGHLAREMDVCKEEIFGPVILLKKFKNDQEAIEIANDTEYGLAACVYSKDVARATKVAAGIQTGTIHINGTTFIPEAFIPLGGTKKSGYGRFNGAYGIKEFTWPKAVTIVENAQYPSWAN
ncbi:hypothetical protein BOTBODRAFT_38187 [Botryobasidium botryosum FD-172 SS1]|uniref:Aldehyde dehydrogenase domain-containing protein n=1 Tax=Botryobasidium botryosum (strain FD-172 SS1) TaxID=930990 RepID=A0A067M8L7_BOTB1|nr:hypothetical protein BOTBODRAFT_38187 [Botryobasidium botryosum FD-172 SS1]